MVMNARDFLQFDVVMFGILLYALLGKAADTATRQLERWLLRWNPNYQHA
jgi:sulfonate transport system permease protein